MRKRESERENNWKGKGKAEKIEIDEKENK